MSNKVSEIEKDAYELGKRFAKDLEGGEHWNNIQRSFMSGFTVQARSMETSDQRFYDRWQMSRGTFHAILKIAKRLKSADK